MGQTIQVIMCKEKSMEKESSNGQMGAILMANFVKIILRVVDFICGVMEDSMKESGNIIKCMEKGPSSGLMEGNI